MEEIVYDNIFMSCTASAYRHILINSARADVVPTYALHRKQPYRSGIIREEKAERQKQLSQLSQSQDFFAL